MTEAEIIESLKTGDYRGIKYLYEKNYTGLCTYAMRFTKNKDTSKEMVQTAFLKLWENRSISEIKESVIAYLFRAVRNNCLNFIKHEQIVNRYNESINKNLSELAEVLQISNENGLSIYLANELESRINEAIESLPEQCREIFKMSRFEGLKHAEIAEKKGLALNTIQKQISIALDKLKNQLIDYFPILIFLFIK
jgi:RNA polymerase sigma-70 factor, ECF subfamily